MKGDSDMMLVGRNLSYQWSVRRQIVCTLKPRQTAVADQVRIWDVRTAAASAYMAVDCGGLDCLMLVATV